jgi:prepilin-type N-terminal cleavage/methylation domain-containing protein
MNSRGLTLLETLVALVLLGAATAMGAELTAQSLRAQARAEETAVALSIADWKLGELSALPADSLRRFVGPDEGGTTTDGREFTWRALAQADPSKRTLWHAGVAVTWANGSVTLESSIFRQAGSRGGTR